VLEVQSLSVRIYLEEAQVEGRLGLVSTLANSNSNSKMVLRP
jgi:hypothetical protein